MPNKTIYVSEGDLPIFERAQELLGGNLSATIAHALRRLVEGHERGLDIGGIPDIPTDYTDVQVKVGKIAYAYKRFKARLLVKGHIAERKQLPKIIEVYQTAKGKLAVYTRTPPLPSHMINPEVDEEWFSNDGEYQLEIFDSLEDLRGHIPDELYEIAAKTLAGKLVEDLDI